MRPYLSHIPCVLFKGSPLRKRMNLIESFPPISFSLSTLSVPCSLPHMGGCIPDTQPCAHSYDESSQLEGGGVVEESLQGQAVLSRLMIHLWTQTAAKSWAWKFIFLHESRPRSLGFKMLLLGKSSGTVKRNHLRKNSLSTTSKGLVDCTLLGRTKEWPYVFDPAWKSHPSNEASKNAMCLCFSSDYQLGWRHN